MDHTIADGLIELSRYDSNFWDTIHSETGFVRLVPETNTALITSFQTLTCEQQAVLSNTSYCIEIY